LEVESSTLQISAIGPGQKFLSEIRSLKRGSWRKDITAEIGICCQGKKIEMVRTHLVDAWW